ncbi:MAG: ribonuclease HII [Candidatus Margulisiibacteriota bacterium]
MPSLLYENRLRQKGFTLIAGIDEVGRGPLAGPVVAAAVILPPQYAIKGLNDSKLLSARQRERLCRVIKAKALAVGVGIAGHLEIDRLHIGRANRLAMERAVGKLGVKPDFLLIDGGRSKIKSVIPQQGMTGADRKSAAVAAASIIAKVARDRIMQKYHYLYRLYRFDRHKGYGTAEHCRLLRQYGPAPIHRRSFRPVGSLA